MKGLIFVQPSFENLEPNPAAGITIEVFRKLFLILLFIS